MIRAAAQNEMHSAGRVKIPPLNEKFITGTNLRISQDQAIYIFEEKYAKANLGQSWYFFDYKTC